MKTDSHTIDEIIEVAKKKNANVNEELIRKAYLFAADAHKDEFRASGEPFIIHPIEAAYTIAELGMDAASICAALLHDVVEDTGKKLAEIEKEFGKDVALLVDGVTKISEIKPKSKDMAEAENIRKILLATTHDIRVIIIKMADKLHNMRTLSSLSEKRQFEIARETLDIYAPIAYRLGMEKIKAELEDLAFKYVYPETYKDLSEKINQKKGERESEIDHFRKMLDDKLKENKIEAKIKGRAKHLYSIWKKMIRKNRPFEEIYDVLALRVVTKDVKGCYDTLGIVHQLWKPIPGHIKDYIAMPKANMYQSLHTIVMAEEGTIIEIQIRDEEMDKIAEEGIAAHWAYKGATHKGHPGQSGAATQSEKFDKKLSWLRQIQDWQTEEKDAKNFVDSVRVDLFQDEIYCFTPKGDVIELPKGATVLDFAYAVHTGIGDICTGGRVNGTFTSIRHILRTGDVIEIITAKNQHPTRSWLKIAKTSKARNKIRKYIQEMETIPVGHMKEKHVEISEDVKSIIEIDGVKKPKMIKLAKCCTPLPGDPVLGFVSRTDIITVHKIDCKNIDKITAEVKKKVKINWRGDVSTKMQLKVEANDRVGLFADILNTISATGTNMSEAKAKMVNKELAQVTFYAEVDDIDHLKDLIERIKRIQSVKRVYIGRMGM